MKIEGGALPVLLVLLLTRMSGAEPTPGQREGAMPRWMVGAPLLLPGKAGTFDETAVKDPSIVYDGAMWRLFYTACGCDEYSLACVSAEALDGLQRAPRYRLTQIRSKGASYGAAPQVFFFEPQKTWYLVYQTRDAHYQPAYSTTKTIENPASWSSPAILVAKEDKEKWIDFWVICDDRAAYLFYTRGHRDVYVMDTGLDEFPAGFRNPRKVFSPVHEAVHVYKAKCLPEYHMFYELRADEGFRRYGLATAAVLAGPWSKVTDDFATGQQLVPPEGADAALWTEEVSHGEMIRSGCDQRLEYDPGRTRFLIQGMHRSQHRGPYPNLRWTLGLIDKQ